MILALSQICELKTDQSSTILHHQLSIAWLIEVSVKFGRSLYIAHRHETIAIATSSAICPNHRHWCHNGKSTIIADTMNLLCNISITIKTIHNGGGITRGCLLS